VAAVLANVSATGGTHAVTAVALSGAGQHQVAVDHVFAQLDL
jgi:hypothetical protein